MSKFGYILILILSLGIGNMLAQDTTITSREFTYFNPMAENIEDYLPPMQELIDSAVANSPLLKYRDAQHIIAELNTKSVRRAWSNYLGVISDFKYGLFDNLVLNQDATGAINTNLVTTTEQTRYSAGVYLKFPLQEILDRKNKIKIAQEQEKLALYEYQSAKRELRKLVIQQYSDLLLAQKVLRIKNSFKQDVIIQKQMAEQQFKNNQISVSEMTKMNSMYSKALAEYETAKSAFNNAYLMLQEVVGIKFKLKSKVK